MTGYVLQGADAAVVGGPGDGSDGGDTGRRQCAHLRYQCP